jgi:hypothetical protein
MDLRSRQVHPKAQRREVVRDDNQKAAFKPKDDVLSPTLKIPFDYYGWSFETARTGLEIVDTFLALYLIDVCGLNHSEVAYSLMPGAGPANGAWKASIMMQDHFPVWQKGRDRCRLKMTYLGDSVVDPQERPKGTA